jgi:glucuronate isomerase
MPDSLRQNLFAALNSVRLIDPHSHIQPLEPASTTLADILGYHYYTELAHSVGMPKSRIEKPGLTPKEKVGRLVEWLDRLGNTIQVSWLIELCQRFFGFNDDQINANNWEGLFDHSTQVMAQPGWDRQVLELSGVESVFLTNDFDDPLEGFDTRVFVPCLRTDDLVFHLPKQSVRERLERTTNTQIHNSSDLHLAIGKLFEHFKRRGARACAISLPPDYSPAAPTGVDDAVHQWLTHGESIDATSRCRLSQFVFWTLAEFCAQFDLPFDLMIGVNRQVYPGGVFQGQDLYDSRVSLIQYKDLFNSFPSVTFPISVLASVTNQELASYAWIFPNVVTNGHWWYSNTPTFIEHDLAARLEAVPQSKQIGYYSDAYKLEFILPKFSMYKRILAKVLAENFVIDRGWKEERAIALGKRLLRTNVEQIFFGR